MKNKEEKPWGYQATVIDRKEYSTRIIVIKEGEQLPYMYNRKRDKSWLLMQGVLQINIEGSTKLMAEGETVHISPGIMHGATAIKGDATVIEVGTKIEDYGIVIVDDKYKR